MRFPQLRGRNLEGEEKNIPEDLGGAILILAFKQSQQSDIDSWRPSLKDHSVYEIPIINSAYRPMRRFIDGGMRSGISDKKIRENTITVYMRKKRLLELLDISDEHIHLYLVDENGEIKWRSEGAYEKGKEPVELLH